MDAYVNLSVTFCRDFFYRERYGSRHFASKQTHYYRQLYHFNLENSMKDSAVRLAVWRTVFKIGRQFRHVYSLESNRRVY